jgi:tetratricopeptide (TPR) repeat protein
LQLTGALLAQVMGQGNSRLVRNLLNLLGVVQFEAGELASAESTWLELLCRASQAQDDNFAARANNNLGIVYTLRGQSYEAVASYERALTAYRQLGYRRGLAQSHHNLAIAYRASSVPAMMRIIISRKRSITLERTAATMKLRVPNRSAPCFCYNEGTPTWPRSPRAAPYAVLKRSAIPLGSAMHIGFWQ